MAMTTKMAATHKGHRLHAPVIFSPPPPPVYIKNRWRSGLTRPTQARFPSGAQVRTLHDSIAPRRGLPPGLRSLGARFNSGWGLTTFCLFFSTKRLLHVGGKEDGGGLNSLTFHEHTGYLIGSARSCLTKRLRGANHMRTTNCGTDQSPTTSAGTGGC